MDATRLRQVLMPAANEEPESEIAEQLARDPVLTPLRELKADTEVTVLIQVLSAQRTTYTITDGTALAELVSHLPLTPGRAYRITGDAESSQRLLADEVS